MLQVVLGSGLCCVVSYAHVGLCAFNFIWLIFYASVMNFFRVVSLGGFFNICGPDKMC